MSWPEPKAVRATPGRLSTALMVSPCVPATLATSSAGITWRVISRRTGLALTTVSFPSPDRSR